MTTYELPETIELSKALLYRVGSASMAGHTYVDEQGRWIVRISSVDDAGKHEIHIREGETLKFVGATWKLTKVYEPTTATRGPVATLTRVQ